MPNADPTHFELFTGQRTVKDILEFIQNQMSAYGKTHAVVKAQGAAHFNVKHGALTAGYDLYHARMDVEAAQVPWPSHAIVISHERYVISHDITRYCCCDQVSLEAGSHPPCSTKPPEKNVGSKELNR